MIQFSKLLNWIVRGQFSLLGQTLQVIALGQKDTSPMVVRQWRRAVFMPILNFSFASFRSLNLRASALVCVARRRNFDARVLSVLVIGRIGVVL